MTWSLLDLPCPRPAGRRIAALAAAALLLAAPRASSQGGFLLQEHYEKHEYRIPMRDGARLFTAVYTPVDRSTACPILLRRTPYSVRPYGEEAFPKSLGPAPEFDRLGYLFVFQDVRGCYQSEGEFVNMRPHLPVKNGPGDVDESTDTHDTIEWLLQNVPGHNGRVGMWGISYPGFYAAAGMVDAHPALKAVSPQAPIADWYFDDFHHHGAFFLAHAFNFFSSFGKPRPGLTTESHPRFEHGTPDGYQFFLEMGALRNAEERYLRGTVPYWKELAEHPDYDAYWSARNLLPHLHEVAPAVMTVGGWFDAEDLYGPLEIYRAVEANNPGIFNVLVMGPWPHGGWARTPGRSLGAADFGSNTSETYREELELPFFEFFLRDAGGPLEIPEASVFETGANRWREFPSWPPPGGEDRVLHVRAGGVLSSAAPEDGEGFTAFPSDPHRPVPYTAEVTIGMTRNYMTEDQRFAARRPDVLTFQTKVLEEAVTVAGPLRAELWVSTSAGDADWVVKLLDVQPPDAPTPDGVDSPTPRGGAQLLVRGEVFRGRYRNSYDRPEPFPADTPSSVQFELLDVLHTFLPGHRIGIQIQSSWFPLVDRNPQKYVPSIFEARDEDYVAATHRVYHTAEFPTALRFTVLPGAEHEPAH